MFLQHVLLSTAAASAGSTASDLGMLLLDALQRSSGAHCWETFVGTVSQSSPTPPTCKQRLHQAVTRQQGEADHRFRVEGL
jgi:hypothetical protein